MTPVRTAALADFLLARIAEDEAELEAAAEAEAEALRHDGMPGTTAAEVAAYWLRPESKTRWPRVLAECKAKRDIVALSGWCDNAVAPALKDLAGRMVLRAMAVIYANHPDYDPAWAPDAAPEDPTWRVRLTRSRDNG